MSFEEKLGVPNDSHNRIYKFTVELIPNDWKHVIRTKTSEDSLLGIFYCNAKDIRKVKDLQKLSNKEIYLILQYNNNKYNKPFKFLLWPNFSQP